MGGYFFPWEGGGGGGRVSGSKWNFISIFKIFETGNDPDDYNEGFNNSSLISSYFLPFLLIQ